jgi:hypothetical protein
MRKLLTLLFSGVFFATSLVTLSVTPASAAATITTCTDLKHQDMLALKESQKSCKSFAAPALWQIQQPDSLAHSGAGYANIRVCSSKNPYFSYQTIKTSCNKNQITTDYWRVISVPEIPNIKEIMALGYDAAVVTFEPLKSETKIKLAVAYYLVTNIKTGQVSKSAPNNFSEIYIYDLNPLTSYTFQITAVSVDGTSAPSSITRMITTGAVPIVYVAPTTPPPASPTTPPLAAPAFTLSSSSETRTVNTASTGFTILSTRGTIASFAISATPAGLSFSTSTGALTGTPTTVAGATTYTITATNASGSATQTFILTVTAGVYTVGQTGPGGGKVFYVATTPFACGSTPEATCTYLEAAPADIGTTIKWAQSTYVGTAVNNANAPTTATATGIGWGYLNTLAIIAQGNTDTANSAAALADSHTVTVSGVIYDDWYLPSKDELRELCKFARSQLTGDPTVACDTTATVPFLNGIDGNLYWSSSEGNATLAWSERFARFGFQNQGDKREGNRVRPVRAF